MIKILIIDHEKTFITKSFEQFKDSELEIIYNKKTKFYFGIIEKVFFKLRIPIDFNFFNKKVINKVYDFLPDLIIIVGQMSNNNIFPSTLRKIRKIKKMKIFSWTPDNMVKRHNTSLFFNKSIPLFDVHFTTKSNIIKELYNKGAKKVVFLNQAYSKYDHYPEPYDKEYDYDIIFIGTAEKERYDSLCFLASNGLKIDVFGNRWKNFPIIKNLKIHNKPLYGYKYRKAISSSKINLCFLRKINDDLQTARSIEIPACRGFMLAEMTDEHSKLFKEDSEAVFFSSNEELLNKVTYYLKNEKKREKIKNSGYKKVTKFNFSYDDVVKRIISNY